ncbi:arginase family protein [Nonomuraea angiospora]|uniref:arginase family protein n=1 Tax=Nonomuraea angiospora TaxID=46172 RepID=UPI0033EAD908
MTTLGGDCSVSVAPFSELARRYGDDLAVIWIDSHPDIGIPRSEYPGYHAMAVAAWGIWSFSPEELRPPMRPLLDWLAVTGCSRVAVHFDVDAVDSREVLLGLGAEPDGLTGGQVRRIVADIDGAADVVALTIAEFFPRQVMHLRQILSGFPLLSATRAD